MFKAAREFETQYYDCMKADKGESKFFREWKDRLTKEILRFNGKAQGLGDE
jgi:hypothetical protein